VPPIRPFQSELSDDDEEETVEDGDQAPKFAFPELDAKIRECIKDYGAVFPKLNFSSPRVRERAKSLFTSSDNVYAE